MNHSSPRVDAMKLGLRPSGRAIQALRDSYVCSSPHVLYRMIACLRILAAFAALAQPQATTPAAEGNIAIRSRVDGELKQIYGSAGARAFLIRRSGLPGISHARDVEVTAYRSGGELRRVVLSGWTDRGKHSSEFFYRDGALIFVYETLVFFEDAAPRDSWRNFMKMPAWERRVYLGERLDYYAETTGSGAPPLDLAALRLRAKQAAELAAASAP